MMAKTSVWWDIENCAVPRDCDPNAIAQNLSSALANLNYYGPISIFAYGDTSQINSSVQQALFSTGIALYHTPSGDKDVYDKKKILVDMLFWAVDNPAPANYLLISGDRAFCNTLHWLRIKRYNILLAQPQKASAPLVAAARSVWLWTSLLAGGLPLSNGESLLKAHTKQDTPSGSHKNSTNTSPGVPEYVPGHAGVILLALKTLRSEKVMPTEANIADCIRYGNPEHCKIRVKKALNKAIKKNMVVNQKSGSVDLFIVKGENLWKSVKPICTDPNQYPQATWDKILKFLASPAGRSAILSSRCRYEAATMLKSMCLKQLALGNILQLLNMAIDIKKWIIHHESGWQPLIISVAENNADSEFVKRIPEAVQGLTGVILLALNILKSVKIMPTEANIADCIRCGFPEHHNAVIKKALDIAIEQKIVRAIEQKMVVNQQSKIVRLYVGKRENVWKSVNRVDKDPNQYIFMKFLASRVGQSAILSSPCRYEAAIMFESIREEKWIKHYSSFQKILLVGEGDFSFAVCLAKAFGSATNIIATSLDSKAELIAKYLKAKRHLEQLEKLGCTIVHEVDAHKMGQNPLLKDKNFDKIVYNFPHATLIRPERDICQIKLHQKVVKGFLKSARFMLSKKGEVHVTHKTSHPFSNWEIVKLGEQVGLYLVEEERFDKWDYPGYENKKGYAPFYDSTFHVGACSTYKFNRCLM